jgi:aminoglycoside phosphotransferase (APT) family kinase protein
MTYDRTIDHETIQRMIARVEPTWEVADATLATAGQHIVYLVTIDGEDGPRECVLKATPAGMSATCDVEARMLAIVDEHTTVPVPAVFGAVDEHPELPAPFFVSERVPGRDFDRTDIGTLTGSQLDGLARSSGRHLASLHEQLALEGYGYVGVDCDEPLDGGRPSANTDQLAVADPTDDWRTCLAESVDGVVAGLDETRFAGLQETVASAVDAAIDRIDDARPRAIDGIDDPGPAVVCRVDHSLDNVLVDPDSGETAAFLDWEFQFAGTPAYDLAFVERSLTGGTWSFTPDAPARGDRIRAGLLAGYRDAGGDAAADRLVANRDAYALLVDSHELYNFEGALDVFGVSEPERAAAADRLRAAVRERCARLES